MGQHRHRQSLGTIVVNDWKKGVLAIQHCLSRQRALSENKHSTGRDVVAVLAAASLAPALVAALIMPLTILAAPMILLCYGVARLDLLICFSGQGAWFLCRAAAVMMMLDLLRGNCAAYGIAAQLAMRLVTNRIVGKAETITAPAGEVLNGNNSSNYLQSH